MRLKNCLIFALLPACSFLSANKKTNIDETLAMPDFFVETSFKPEASRRPASIGKMIKENDLDDEAKFSNRKIYFLTLLSQYKEMKALTRFDSPDIKICPNFHTDIINTKSEMNKKYDLFFDLQKFAAKVDATDAKLAHHPELTLPITHESLHPSVYEASLADKTKFQDNLRIALKIHMKKTYQELSDMCEKGQTDNYYVFDNLVNFAKDQHKIPDHGRHLRSLFKSNVFANMYILKSLKSKSAEGRSVASLPKYNKYENEVISRARVSWMNDYFEKVIK